MRCVVIARNWSPRLMIFTLP